MIKSMMISLDTPTMNTLTKRRTRVDEPTVPWNQRKAPNPRRPTNSFRPMGNGWAIFEIKTNPSEECQETTPSITVTDSIKTAHFLCSFTCRSFCFLSAKYLSQAILSLSLKYKSHIPSCPVTLSVICLKECFTGQYSGNLWSVRSFRFERWLRYKQHLVFSRISGSLRRMPVPWCIDSMIRCPVWWLAPIGNWFHAIFPWLFVFAFFVPFGVSIWRNGRNTWWIISMPTTAAQTVSNDWFLIWWNITSGSFMLHGLSNTSRNISSSPRKKRFSYSTRKFNVWVIRSFDWSN